TMRDHIIIVGYGNMGSFICKAIPFKERILVIEAHPNRVKLAKGAGLKVIGGDASSPILLEAAGLESAALAIITMPDSETATITAENIHNVNPSLKILARARSMEHMQQLISKGCSESIVPEYEASLTMLRDISAIMRFPIDAVNKILNQVRDKQYGPLLTQGDSEEDSNDTENAEDKKDG
ncbi:NAD-binding protein, partial [bacterium]|nr:NAD-binding protein [bacterium]